NQYKPKLPEKIRVGYCRQRPNSGSAPRFPKKRNPHFRSPCHPIVQRSVEIRSPWAPVYSHEDYPCCQSRATMDSIKPSANIAGLRANIFGRLSSEMHPPILHTCRHTPGEAFLPFAYRRDLQQWKAPNRKTAETFFLPPPRSHKAMHRVDPRTSCVHYTRVPSNSR